MANARDRFWSRVVPEPNTGCWLWLGSVDHDGYGLFKLDGKQQKAHRVALALSGRPPNSNEVVRHHCDQRSCVNPSHLQAGTVIENNRDALVRNRRPGHTDMAALAAWATNG